MMTKAQRGVTLVELLVSLTIGLFIVAGLMVLLGAMKQTNTSQSGLSQLQDSERIALTIMTDVIQEAGYYTNPVANTAVSSFPTNATFLTAGQYVFGTGLGTAAAPGDTITVRYNTAGGDGVMNCLGGTSASALTYVNVFSVSGTNLQCRVDTVVAGVTTPGTTTTIVAGVTSLNIYYGVQSNPGSGTISADTYLDATSVTAGSYWTRIKSVQVTLAFTNPLAGLPGQTGTAKATVAMTRVIPVMATL